MNPHRPTHASIAGPERGAAFEARAAPGRPPA